jgi:hypothetical protein
MMVKNAVNTLYTAFLRAVFAEKNSLCTVVIGLITYNVLHKVMHNNGKINFFSIIFYNRYCKG